MQTQCRDFTGCVVWTGSFCHGGSSGVQLRDWGDVVMGYEIKSGFGIVLRLWAFGYYAIPAAKLDPVD